MSSNDAARIYLYMSQDPILAFVEHQEWLGPIQQAGESLVNEAYHAAGENGQAIKNALHGVWLGHPLHSAITDVPIGSWTAAAVLDVMEASGQRQYAPGADAAIAVGLAGAVGAAVTGLTDWSDTQGKQQRLGAMHGLLNIGAAALYTASYAFRKAGKRGAGRSLSFTGYALVVASAFLGGALSYTEKVGVNHSPDPDEELPQEFQPACAEADLSDGEPKAVDVNGTPIFLLKRGEAIYALANTCSHLGGPLNEGKVEGDFVICPWHGSRFCLKDGSVIDGPATTPQPALAVEVRDGQVMVRAKA